MVWNVNGVLGWSPHNMCLRSQEFDNATPWNPTTAVTVVANAIAAPDGTLTADRIVETAGTNNHQLIHSSASYLTGETYTVSVYAKAGERNWLAIQSINATVADWFDLTNGVVGTSANGGVITPVGNGWYRCSITFVKNATAGGPTFSLCTANGQVAVLRRRYNKGSVFVGCAAQSGLHATAISSNYHYRPLRPRHRPRPGDACK